ncbi:hypothetical protein P7K49_039603, partial [Saguinus oedipus]
MPVLRSLHRKRFQTSPSTHELYLLYCYFVICGNSAGNACFEMTPQKAFPDFPFNTRVIS